METEWNVTFLALEIGEYLHVSDHWEAKTETKKVWKRYIKENCTSLAFPMTLELHWSSLLKDM